MFHIKCIQENSNLKQDNTAHLSEWHKSKVLTILNADENVEQQEFSFIAGGNTKLDSHTGGQFGGFLQN